MIPDEGLLAEVSGLAEWPVVYIGTIQPEFMDVPAEILQTSMRTHQKYFSLRDPKTGKMANRFRAGRQHDRSGRRQGDRGRQ
jgi:glycyl-tRNA synthetase beta chain